MAKIPTNPNFDFNDIRLMDPYPALILLGQPNLATSLLIGSLTPVQPNQVSYVIRLKEGQLGKPSLEITITAPAIETILFSRKQVSVPAPQARKRGTT